MLRVLRKTHLYFGLFIAPALLFFAFTGAMQTLSLHEAAGNDYKPPALLAELGQLHKNQTPVLPARKSPPASATLKNGGVGPRGTAAPTAPPAAPPPPPVTLANKEKQHLPMKIFFLVVALGLFTSTLTGIYMAYKYDRSKALVTGLLLAGILIPLLLLRF